jgi:hypothetical protein
MACGCGEKFQQVFPAHINYAVYFDAQRTTIPASWRADELAVCLCCGEITSSVPADVLADLRQDDAELMDLAT